MAKFLALSGQLYVGLSTRPWDDLNLSCKYLLCVVLFTLCNLETVVSTIDSPAHLFVIP